MIQLLWQDVHHALRLLRRQPGFALGAILILALGIGPLTAISSLMNAALYRPWQVPAPDSMVVVQARRAGQEVTGAISVAEYRHLRQYSRAISHMTGFTRGGTSSLDDGAGQAWRVQSAFVGADYFRALRVGMIAGPGFSANDEDYGAPKAVVVVSDRLWRNRFGGNPALVGSRIGIAGRQFEVVGIAARGFLGVDRGAIDVWMPLPAWAFRGNAAPTLDQFSNPRARLQLSVVGRLGDGSTRQSAAAELSSLSTRFRSDASLPSNGIDVRDTRPMLGIDELPPELRQRFGQRIVWAQTALLLTTLLVLLVTCANVGNVLLARALSRRRDIAIRLSLGASRARLVRQLLIEAGMLSAAAAALGYGLALIVPRAMVAFGFGFSVFGFQQGAPNPNTDAVRASFYAPDALVFWLAVLFAGVTTVLAGLAPALRATRISLAAAAAERQRHTAAGARLRLTLLAAQIAVTMLLLVGAGLLTRAIAHAMSLNPGFTIDGIQVVSVEAKTLGTQGARRDVFWGGLLDGLNATDAGPVAFSQEPPLSDSTYVMMARLPGDSPARLHTIALRPVSRSYFAVLRIPIVRGRALACETDCRELVVSEAAAGELWPGTDPIGKTLDSVLSADGAQFERFEIVGVAKDVPVRSMSEIEPVIYRPPQWFVKGHLIVRNASPGVAGRVRAVAGLLEPNVVVTGRPLADYVRDALATAVLASRAAWAIGGLGLLIAMVGAFGVFAFAVEARRREIGIRVALGASRKRVAELVFRTAGQALIWGLGAGFLLSLLAVPVWAHFLYGLSPIDPIAYVEVAGILVVMVVLATWIPARRALAVDPAVSLRCE